jgi:hypothetical protein
MKEQEHEHDQAASLGESPENVNQRCATAIAGAADHAVKTARPNALVATRWDAPKRRIMLVALGGVAFLLSLAAGLLGGVVLGLVVVSVFGSLLAFSKKTETSTISASPAPAGRACAITVSGLTTARVTALVDAVLAGSPLATIEVAPVPTPARPGDATEERLVHVPPNLNAQQSSPAASAT